MAGRNPNIFYLLYDHRRDLSLLSVGISNLVTHYRSCNERIIILGDCNIHFNNPLDYKTAKFLDAMLKAGFNKMASFSTHCYGHTLDRILCSPSVSITDFFPGDCNLSDHCPVFFSTNIEKTILPISYWWKRKRACSASALNMELRRVLVLGLESKEKTVTIHCLSKKMVRKEKLYLVDDDVVAQRRETRKPEWQMKTVCSSKFVKIQTRSLCSSRASRKKRCSFLFLQSFCAASDSKICYESIMHEIKQ